MDDIKRAVVTGTVVTTQVDDSTVPVARWNPDRSARIDPRCIPNTFSPNRFDDRYRKGISMVIIPNGQASSAQFGLCKQCGTSTQEQKAPEAAQRRRFSAPMVKALGLVSVLAAAVVTTVLVVARQHDEQQSAPAATTASAIREWWADSRTDFIALRTALDDSQEALQQADVGVLKTSCQKMHDVAAVDLAARMPTPDARLTTELKAATDDAHDAAHICLSTIAGAMISYRAEFDTDLDQAYKHLTAAREIIDRVVSDTRYA